MSLKTGITMLVLASAVSAARADVFVNPMAGAMLRTDPSQNPANSLIYPTGTALSATFLNPASPTTSLIVQAGMTFDLRQIAYSDASISAYRLVFSTTSYARSPGYEIFPITTNVTYGADATETFSLSNFFGSSPPPATSGVVGVVNIPLFDPQTVVKSFDITTIMRNARSGSALYPFLKFWVTAPNQGNWNFVPTLQLVGVPEPSTVFLMSLGLCGGYLFALKNNRVTRHS
ncbi:MAG: PEP-CTERM sorting domain-containing protein [Isosphaeraceae bacterium]